MTVLDREVRGKRLAPHNSEGINFLPGAQIDHYPLRITRILFLREMLIKIRIALPKTLSVGVVKTRVAIVVRLIDRVAAPRQPVAIAYLNWLAGLVVRSPVALMVRRLAP